jgi:hypothetical protein
MNRLGADARSILTDGETDYQRLVNYGHSPQKAAEIVLDAKRNDEWAIKYLAFIRDGGSIKL